MRASLATRLFAIVLAVTAVLTAVAVPVAARTPKAGVPAPRSRGAAAPQVHRPAPPSGIDPHQGAAAATSWAWIEGPWTYQYETDCVTGGIAFHNAYAGYYGATDGSGPQTNTVYYMNVGFSVGGGCAGGVAGSTWAWLPRGTSLAVSAQYPVRCMWDALDGKGFREITASNYADCHTNPSADANGKIYFGTAQIPNFTMFEVWFPVVSTQPLVGSAGPNGGDAIQAQVMIGTADPQAVHPHGWIWANGGTVHQPDISVSYPDDAITGLTCAAAKTTGYVYNQFSAGNAYIDLGRQGHGYEATAGPVALANTESAYAVFANWNLASEQTYHWRVRFVHGGSTTTGADQIFTTPDCIAPTGSLSINGGAAATMSHDVTLALSATDGTGVTQMRLRDADGDWTGWRAYATSAGWTLADGVGTRSVSAQFRDAAGNVSTAASDSIEVKAAATDTTPPVAKAPTVSLAAHTSLKGGVAVTVGWPAATDANGIARYELQRSTGGAAWTGVTLATATARQAVLHLPAGSSTTFRVRAFDPSGNASAWATGAQAHASLAEEAAAGTRYTGTWRAARNAAASGGSLRFATAAGASVSRSIRGTSAAIVAAVGPDRGRARISVDGKVVASVDLYAAKAAYGQVVAVVPLKPGAHTLEVRALGTKSADSAGTRVDLDAFVVLN